jgi:hypothetical protein
LHHPHRVKTSSTWLDAGDGLDTAIGYGFDEGVVVALVLVGDGVIERVVDAEVFSDDDRVA